MSDLYPALVELANRFGIAQEFWDWKGRHVPIPAETIVDVLRAFDVDASSPEATDGALRRLEDKRWQRVVPACTVVEQGHGAHVPIHITSGDHVDVWLQLESGETRQTWQTRPSSGRYRPG